MRNPTREAQDERIKLSRQAATVLARMAEQCSEGRMAFGELALAVNTLVDDFEIMRSVADELSSEIDCLQKELEDSQAAEWASLSDVEREARIKSAMN